MSVEKSVRSFQRWRWFYKNKKAFWQFESHRPSVTKLYLNKTKKEHFPLKLWEIYIRRDWIERL